MALNMMGVAVSLLEESAQRREVGVSEMQAAEVDHHFVSWSPAPLPLLSSDLIIA